MAKKFKEQLFKTKTIDPAEYETTKQIVKPEPISWGNPKDEKEQIFQFLRVRPNASWQELLNRFRNPEKIRKHIEELNQQGWINYQLQPLVGSPEHAKKRVFDILTKNRNTPISYIKNITSLPKEKIIELMKEFGISPIIKEKIFKTPINYTTNEEERVKGTIERFIIRKGHKPKFRDIIQLVELPKDRIIEILKKLNLEDKVIQSRSLLTDPKERIKYQINNNPDIRLNSLAKKVRMQPNEVKELLKQINLTVKPSRSMPVTAPSF